MAERQNRQGGRGGDRARSGRGRGPVQQGSRERSENGRGPTRGTASRAGGSRTGLGRRDGQEVTPGGRTRSAVGRGRGRTQAGVGEAPSFESRRGPKATTPRALRTVGPRQGRPPRSEEPAVDTALVVGRHPVLEALKSGRSINKILVSESAEGGSLTEILAKAKAGGVVVQRVPRVHLDEITDTSNHQGIAAYTAAHDYVELDEIISRETGQQPLVVLLDEVSDPYNLGAVLRSAEATGVQGVVIPKRRAVPLTETVGKAAAGAMEYVPVARVANLVQAMETLKAAGYWIVGTDVTGAQTYTSVDYQGPIAIVIGAEGQGLSRLVRDKCDYLVSLPMLGKLQSLNASVATGVLLYEVVRQRG